MTITITNADISLIKIIETLNEKISIPYEIISDNKISNEEKTENDFTPKFEAEVLQDFKETTESIENGTLKTYKTFEEYQRAMSVL